jgi:hypothetical protein
MPAAARPGDPLNPGARRGKVEEWKGGLPNMWSLGLFLMMHHRIVVHILTHLGAR